MARRRGPTVVVKDASLPADRFILEGIDTSREPHFTVSEVAKFFFGMSAHWVRWRERKGDFFLDGEAVGSHRTPEGARYYTLSDVEKMAHALAEKDNLSVDQLTNALLLVQAEARVWGYLGGEEETEEDA